MSEKRFISQYGNYDSANSVFSFGNTTSDGTVSVKSSLPNMIQTSINSKGLGTNNSSTNSIQKTTIITSDSKKGTYIGSGTYNPPALLASNAHPVTLNYSFNTTPEISRMFEITADVMVIIKIDSIVTSGTTTINGTADSVYVKKFKFDGCVSRARTNDKKTLTESANTIVLAQSWETKCQSSEMNDYITNTAMDASIVNSILTFTITPIADINYSYEMLITANITAVDIN